MLEAFSLRLKESSHRNYGFTYSSVCCGALVVMALYGTVRKPNDSATRLAAGYGNVRRGSRHETSKYGIMWQDIALYGRKTGHLLPYNGALCHGWDMEPSGIPYTPQLCRRIPYMRLSRIFRRHSQCRPAHCSAVFWSYSPSEGCRKRM